MGQLAYNLYTLPRPTDMERPWPTDAVLLLSDYDNDSDDTIRSASRTDGDILYMRTAESQWITFLLHTQRAVQQKREAHKWTMQNPRFWGDTPIEAHQSFKRALHRRFPNAKHMFELYRVFAERQALLMSANDPDPETPMSLEDFTLLLRAMRDQLVAGEFCKHARGVMADAMWFKVGVLPKDVVKAVQECHV